MKAAGTPALHPSVPPHLSFGSSDWICDVATVQLAPFAPSAELEPPCTTGKDPACRRRGAHASAPAAALHAASGRLTRTLRK